MKVEGVCETGWGGSLWNRMSIESCWECFAQGLQEHITVRNAYTCNTGRCHRSQTYITHFEYIILNIFELPAWNIGSLIDPRAESLQLQINSDKSSLAFMKCRSWVVKTYVVRSERHQIKDNFCKVVYKCVFASWTFWRLPIVLSDVGQMERWWIGKSFKEMPSISCYYWKVLCVFQW